MEKERVWTSEQLTAIDLRGRDLLVSAGAGSGKTSVMAERIIRRICDEDDPCGIDEIVVVTFSEAAAAEIRTRLVRELRNRASSLPNPRIKQAIAKIGAARISTISSFCLSLVKRGFASLGLPASLRIADEYENSVICSEVMDDVIDAFFKDSARYGVVDFPSLCENFILDRDSRLAEKFLALYFKLDSVPEGVRLLKKKAEELRGLDGKNFFLSDWGRLILNETVSRFKSYERRFTDALEYFDGDEVLEAKYGPCFKNALSLINSVLAGEQDYENIRKMLSAYKNVGFGRAGLKEYHDINEISLYVNSRDDFNKTLKKINSWYSMPAQEISMLSELTADSLRDLGAFLEEFEARLLERKRDLGVLSFADCEHYAAALLIDRDGNPTPFAQNYRDRIKEIYIDEYQDTNELQDMIFGAISRPCGRFMVGDVKQSIYGFRSSDPDLFASYRAKWKQYSPGDCNTESSVFLSSNFRSAKRILGTVNSVFSSLFGASSEIDYREEDELHFPAGKEEDPGEPARIVIAEDPSLNRKRKTPDEEKTEETERFSDPLKPGAEYVASKISSLIASGDPPGECAVLVRTKAMIPHIEKALGRYGIPYDTASKEEFFKFPEIQFVMSVLRVIDNPMNDVYLAAVLSGPLYGMSLDDLTVLRTADRKSPLIDVIQTFDSPVISDFLRDLEEWRKLARSTPSHTLIRRLYDEYGLINAACARLGEKRRGIVRMNCIRLYDVARSFEGDSFKGLYGFLEYIDSLTSSKYQQSLPTGSSGNGVRISTIHGSKGLEYKNCFVYVGTGLVKSRDDNEIVFSKRLGFAFRVREKNTPFKYDTPFRKSIMLENELKSYEEELRVLYVALTRAKERLFVVCEATDPDGEIEKYRRIRKYVDKTFISENDNFKVLILSSLAGLDRSGDFELIAVPYAADADHSSAETRETDAAEQTDASSALKELAARLSYEYPHSAAVRIPAKLSVSRLYPGLLDEADESADLEDEGSYRLAEPRFGGAEKRKDAAYSGTATHIFMQFCDFGSLRENGAEYELQRLRSEKFLSDEAADAVNVDHIRAFVGSRLFADILDSGEIWRERRFNVMLPANEFVTGDPDPALEDETVLVQGVVDCVYALPDGDLVLVDYKTDSVKGKSDAEARQMLRERHSLQLGYYKRALEKLTGRRVAKTMVYSFGLGDTVELDV